MADKVNKINFPLTLWFLYQLAFILFVITHAQTVSNIAVYGSASQLVI